MMRQNFILHLRSRSHLLSRPGYQIRRAVRAIVMLAIALLALPVTSASAATILILGDSLSAGYGIELQEGWVALLDTRLKGEGEYTVINASISGDTTSGGLTRLDKALSVHQPDLVIIELGGNDGLRGIPLQTIERNLAEMVNRTRASGAQALLVGMRIPPNLGPLYTERFHRIYSDVATALDVPRVPFLLEGVATDPARMQDDGIHPNVSGQPRMLDNVWPVLYPILQSFVNK